MSDEKLIVEARAWLAADPDDDTRRHLGQQLTQLEDPALRADALNQLRSQFAGFLQFGTAGLRGRTGPGPSRMNRVVVGAAAVLMEEVAATKISGEEDRYSRTDLWDFRANFDGSQKIYELVRPLIADQDADFVTKVDANFKDVDAVLEKYRSEDGGFVSYEKLTDEDRNLLSVKVNTLAEDLATLRGKLGLG